MKKLLLLPLIAISLVAKAQTTAIPDANFEQALINLDLDSVIDGGVLTANISNVSSLSVDNNIISDLTGIEGFTALEILNCGYNQLTNLDVSQNTALTELRCFSNLLTSLDLSQNIALDSLDCHVNQLTNLDLSENSALTFLYCGYNLLTSIDVNQNTALDELWCYDNQLTNLDVTQNTALEYLACGYNDLTSLDVSQNTNLTILGFSDNHLTSLDVSQNTNLTYLDCSDNQLTSLDVTQNTALELFYCYSNELISIDVSHNPLLYTFRCFYNQLTCLNMKSGNNANLYLGQGVYLENNPNLTCIEVDDVAYSTTNWTNIDPQHYFSTNCNNSCSSTTSINATALNTFEFYPNPTTSTITLNNLQLGDEVSVYNTLGQRVYSSKVTAVTLSINLSELGNNGIYFVRVNNLSERVLLSRGL